MKIQHQQQTVSITFLGVEFRWGHLTPELIKEAREATHSLQKHLSSKCQIEIKRQKRTRCTYADVLTEVHRGNPTELYDNKAFLLAADLSCGIAQGLIPPSMILELARFAPIAKMQQTIRLLAGNQNSPKSIDVQGLTIEQIKATPSDRAQSNDNQIQRHLIIDMDEQTAAEARINWNELPLLSTLAHLKCDIEVMIDTGFLPIQMCERGRCSAFYRPNRMSGRSRFCSNTCRASAPREEDPNS